MDTAHIILTTLTLTACLLSAAIDFAAATGAPRWNFLIVGMEKIGVPRSWLPWLGAAKAAAGFGLLAGFWLPPLGTAAAAGLVLFFIGALVFHTRARDYAPGGQHLFLAMATGTLVLTMTA